LEQWRAEPETGWSQGDDAMKRIAAAAATLVLGVTMCTTSAQAQERERYTNSLRPMSAPSIGAAPAARNNERRAPWQGSRASDRGIARSQRERIYDRERDRVYDDDDRRDDPSWGESAMIVGGTAAAGAGVGGLIGGTKGALIGAAIGGGGAAIYEGTRRR
jgi:hypothetical protein